MNTVLHSLDAHYASVSDGEIEALWRSTVVDDANVDLVVVRQLVLRAFEVIEMACAERGALLGFGEHDCARASDEAALKLLARLRRDRHVANVRALAHALALEVLGDTLRSRTPNPLRFAPPRPQLRLVTEGGDHR
jgi:hypothetical protein